MISIRGNLFEVVFLFSFFRGSDYVATSGFTRQRLRRSSKRAYPATNAFFGYFPIYEFHLAGFHVFFRLT